MTDIAIRLVQKEDYASIFKVNELAFKQKEEAELVEALRGSQEYIQDLEFVALHEKKIIGHILYSKVLIGSIECDAVALAPMSVLPSFQKQGIGSMLIEHSLVEAKKNEFKSVIVLGHPGYYPRFGFKPAWQWGVKFPHEVPNDVFMALPLTPDGLNTCRGVVTYSSAFGI